ncbi:MAG: acyl-CoA dehydrogenase [candidate division Zixibacteria bacterium DG_27]|nr:MAG: acyl-CoA dehydrogenase [candidate division Zixibacteria bacterium DG_27]
MEFELSEDQKLIKDAARQFTEKRLIPGRTERDEKEELEPEIYKELGELGYFGMIIPEEYGGMGLDALTYITALEEIARGDAGLTICLSVHNSLASEPIRLYGKQSIREKYLPKMASGEWIGAYCLSEPEAGSDAANLKATAIKKGDHYLLNGTKSFVTSGGFAGIYVIFCATDRDKGSHGISAFAVERDTPGLILGAKEKKLGINTSDTRQIILEDCKVPAENLLGEENHGFGVALSVLNYGRTGVGAQAVGIAQAAFEEATSYSKERKQFGQPICNFQAIQFKLADMATRINAARLLVYRAAWLISKGEECRFEAAMAKLYASETANWVANQAVQILGGYGYMKEYPVERFFRDARVTEIYEGTSEVQRMVISRSILK